MFCPEGLRSSCHMNSQSRTKLYMSMPRDAAVNSYKIRTHKFFSSSNGRTPLRSSFLDMRRHASALSKEGATTTMTPETTSSCALGLGFVSQVVNTYAQVLFVDDDNDVMDDFMVCTRLGVCITS